MTFDAMEQSLCAGEPWACYWFSCGTDDYRYAAGDAARTIATQVYEPEAISHSERDQNQELNSGAITVTVPHDNPVAALFAGYLPAQPVSLVVYRGHETDAEIVVYYTGQVSGAKFTDAGTCELIVVPEQNALKRSIPAVHYQYQCVRQLFSPKCGVNKTLYTVPAPLTDVSGNTITSPAFAAYADGYFNGGWVEGGGTARSVISHVGSVLTLFYSIPGLVSGESVVAFPGCDHTETCCETRFNHLVNHYGFARIPSTNPFAKTGIN